MKNLLSYRGWGGYNIIIQYLGVLPKIGAKINEFNHAKSPVLYVIVTVVTVVTIVTPCY